MKPSTEAPPPDAGAEPPPKKGGRRKLLLAVPVLLAAAGAAAWFSGALGAAPRAAQAGAPVYVDLPEIDANLNGNPRKPSYLKLHAKLEVAGGADAAAVAAAMPRVLDLFQTYLREARPEELRGSAGVHRLREELIARSSVAAAPARVQDVLFTELVVQ